MIDTEKFIKCVKTNPTIWKRTVKGYGDKLCRDRSWKLIGQQMFEEWNQMTEDDKLDEVRNLKNKWRHIRDGYQKYLNQGKGRFTVRKKSYVYADHLSFLLQGGAKSAAKGQEAIEQEDNQLSNQTTAERTESQISFKKPGVRLASQRLLANRQQQVIKRNQQATTPQTRLDDDPDRFYLLSLLPEFKKLNDDEKLDFRFHTLQFFRVIRSKRSSASRRSAEYTNGWNETMDQVDDSSGRGTSQLYVASPCHSPRASQDASLQNSPEDSIRSENSIEYLPLTKAEVDIEETDVI